MSENRIRYVNVVPAVKVKIKKEIEDEDDTISCRFCYKSFANDMALSNHVRMEHTEAYASRNLSDWILPVEIDEKPKLDVKSKEEQKKIIKQKTDELISSMAPTSLMSLASKDVSYIIIKAEDVESVTRKRKITEKVEKPVVAKKEKEPQPITGPFECLQPSNLVTDGVCHQIFFSCCEYSTHYRDEHTRRRKGLRCQVCEKPLNPGQGEEPQSPYTCQVCGTGFLTSKELTEHTNRAHVKLKPFECTICHKRFTQQGGVQQHMRMHTGDRPFPCTYCPKAFTQKSGLDQHLRIHTKVKPYRCVICEKTFCQSVHLKQHMRTHTNVSPFQCGICQKRFKQSSHLNYHLRAHNAGNMTDEQKRKYTELLGLMSSNEIIEVEVDQNQVELQVEHEQAVAEQSISVNGEPGYILSDNGNETWSMKLINS